MGRLPSLALYGKYLFGEITTGQIFYADYEEMVAADDGDPATMAEIHSLDILWDNPNDSPDSREQLYTTDTSGGAVLGPMFHMIRHSAHVRVSRRTGREFARLGKRDRGQRPG